MGLIQNKKTGNFIGRMCVPRTKKRIEKDLQTKSRRLAEKRYLEWKADCIGQRIQFSPTTITLGKLAEWDIRRAKEEVKSSARVVKFGVAQHWKNLLSFFEPDNKPFSPCVLTLAQIKAYMGARFAGKLGRGKTRAVGWKTVKVEIGALKRAVVEASETHGIPLPVPLEKWPRWKKYAKVARKDPGRSGKRIPRHIIEAWLKLLDGECKRKCTFLLYTGLRAEELQRMQENHITPPQLLNDNAKLFVIGKTGNREITLSTPAYAALCDQLAARSAVMQKAGQVWTNRDNRRQMDARAVEVGFKQGIHRRDLRHTFCSDLVASGKDLYCVMEYVGHSSTISADIYQTRFDNEVALVAHDFAASRTLAAHVAPSQTSMLSGPPATARDEQIVKSGGLGGGQKEGGENDVTQKMA